VSVHVARTVAPADGEDIDVDTAKVLSDAVELLDRTAVRRTAVIAETARQTKGGARIAQIVPAFWVEDDTDPDMLFEPESRERSTGRQRLLIMGQRPPHVFLRPQSSDGRRFVARFWPCEARSLRPWS